MLYTNRDLPPLTYATYTDTKGRDEQWWRNTVKQHQVATAEADEELERAYRLFELSVLPLHDFRRVGVSTGTSSSFGSCIETPRLASIFSPRNGPA